MAGNEYIGCFLTENLKIWFPIVIWNEKIEFEIDLSKHDIILKMAAKNGGNRVLRPFKDKVTCNLDSHGNLKQTNRVYFCENTVRIQIARYFVL